MEFEVELNEFEESYFESLALWYFEEHEDVLDDFLEKRMVVDCKLSIDIRCLLTLLHQSIYR